MGPAVEVGAVHFKFEGLPGGPHGEANVYLA